MQGDWLCLTGVELDLDKRAQLPKRASGGNWIGTQIELHYGCTPTLADIADKQSKLGAIACYLCGHIAELKSCISKTVTKVEQGHDSGTVVVSVAGE